MLRMILIGLGVKSPEEISAGLQRSMQIGDGLNRVDQVFEDVHGRDHVERLIRQSLLLEIDEPCRPPALRQSPATEPQQDRADVRERHLEIMMSEEDGSRSDARAEIEVAAATVPPREIERRHVSEG